MALGFLIFYVNVIGGFTHFFSVFLFSVIGSVELYLTSILMGFYHLLKRFQSFSVPVFLRHSSPLFFGLYNSVLISWYS